MSTVRNEQTKISANFLNTLASAALVVGVFAPVAAASYGLNTAPPEARNLAIGVAVWFLVGVGLHLGARYVLKGLMP